MRTWLQLEFLLQQLYRYQALSEITNELTLFLLLVDLLDVLELSELRSDMLNVLERQQQKLLVWEGMPEVDNKRVSTLRAYFRQCATMLMAAPKPVTLFVF